MPQQDPGGGGEELPPAPAIPKSERPRPGPPGGGPGTPPPGILGGFSGRRAAPVFRGLMGLGENLPVLLRRRGIRMPSAPSPPGRTDTVPAMLTPGEKVIPQNISQDPQFEPMLDEMIAAGQERMGFNAGGEVPELGSGRPSRAIRILQMLLDLDDQDGVQGFQYGGTANRGFGPIDTSNVRGMTPSLAGGGGGMGGFAPGPGGFRSGAAPSGFISGNIRRGLTPGPGQQGGVGPGGPGFGYSRNERGDVTNFNPNDPWGSQAGSQNPNAYGAINRLIGQAGQQGAFDPRGNQALLAQMLEGAQGTKDALVRRSMSQANLLGLDPAQQAAAKLRAQQEAGRGVQDIAAQTRAKFASDQDQFLKQMLGGLSDVDMRYILQEQAGNLQRMADKENRRAGRGGGVGGLIGAGVGAFTGGLG